MQVHWASSALLARLGIVLAVIRLTCWQACGVGHYTEQRMGFFPDCGECDCSVQ